MLPFPRHCGLSTLVVSKVDSGSIALNRSSAPLIVHCSCKTVAKFLILNSDTHAPCEHTMRTTARAHNSSWACSIAGFGVMTCAAANDADRTPASTAAISYGAVFYHTTVSITYIAHMQSAVILSDWLFGACLHAVGAVAFAHHLLTRSLVAQNTKEHC